VGTLTHRFEEALIYAAQLHAEQVRKGSRVPYISHLISVAGLTLEYGGGEDEAIAALLHDAVEDQGGQATRLEILRRFGVEVTAIVDGCTDTDTIPKPPWRARKEAYIAELRSASRAVRLVSACDKLHNARTLVMEYRRCGETLWTRFHGGRDGTLWYYRAIVLALRPDGIADLVDELNRVVTVLESLAAIGGASAGRLEN
jgi:(p)ppGpp synthase/HD superfamily hydrolase